MAGMQTVMRQCKYKTDPLSHQQCKDGYIQVIAFIFSLHTNLDFLSIMTSCHRRILQLITQYLQLRTALLLAAT
eukprot:SAG31_NODE_108_length_24741_cov_6.933041_14_plen_74_part_00